MKQLIVCLMLLVSFDAECQKAEVDYEECALLLYDILYSENYESLDKYIISIEDTNHSSIPAYKFKEMYEKYTNEFIENFKLAHDSLNIDSWEKNVSVSGDEINYPSIKYEGKSEWDSVKIHSVTLLSKGLFYYNELKFELQEVNQECKLFSPFIETKKLMITERNSTRDFSE